jgi:hypothetical protein
VTIGLPDSIITFGEDPEELRPILDAVSDDDDHSAASADEL